MERKEFYLVEKKQTVLGPLSHGQWEELWRYIYNDEKKMAVVQMGERSVSLCDEETVAELVKEIVNPEPSTVIRKIPAENLVSFEQIINKLEEIEDKKKIIKDLQAAAGDQFEKLIKGAR